MKIGVLGNPKFDDYGHFRWGIYINFNYRNIELVYGGYGNIDWMVERFEFEFQIPIIKDNIYNSEHLLIFWDEEYEGINEELSTKKKKTIIKIYPWEISKE